jgi:predicted ArsR family transcriptional regulator
METRGAGPSGETIDTPRHRALGSASRVAILRLVQAADAGLTAGDVAERTGLHFSTVRAHLERLVEAGLLIKARASDGGPGRPAWRYRAAAPEPAPAPYRTLAAALLDHLATAGGGVPAAARAGQAWGRRLAAALPSPTSPVEATLAVLRDLGFDPHLHQVSGAEPPAPGTDRSSSEAEHPPGDQESSTVDVRTSPAAATRSARAAGRSAPDPTSSPRATESSPRDTTDVEVHLRTCPFLELVGQQPDVMCALHAGVIRGVLRTVGDAGEAVLEPFAAPNACVARLRIPTDHSGQR